MNETLARDRQTVSYTRMDEGRLEDYVWLEHINAPFRAATASRVLAHLELLHHSYQGEQVERVFSRDPWGPHTEQDWPVQARVPHESAGIDNGEGS